MPNPSISVELGKIDDSLADEMGQELMDYVSFRQGTHWSYNASDDHIHNFQDTVAKSAQYVQHEMPTDVLRARDDYQSTLELATR